MSSGSDRLTLLDACAVINLYASGNMTQIVACIEGRVGITSIVERESLYIMGRSEPDDRHEREVIDLSSMIASGLIEILSAGNNDELSTFIDYAVDLDDGEAMMLALAQHRNGIVVTDDRKAIRLAPDSVTVRSSLGLIKTWIDSNEVDQATQRDALIAVQERASYIPGKNHELREWWDRVQSGE